MTATPVTLSKWLVLASLSFAVWGYLRRPAAGLLQALFIGFVFVWIITPFLILYHLACWLLGIDP